MVSSHWLCAWAFPVSLQTSVQSPPQCMPLTGGLHTTTHYGSQCSGLPCGPWLHNTTAYKDKNQGCLARHHFPNRDDSQTQGRFLFVEYLSSNVLGFAGYCVRLGGCCYLNMLVAMWLQASQCWEVGLLGGD